MNNRKAIKDELNELNSGLPSAGDQQSMSVPEGYFDNLAGNILSRIKQEKALTAAEEIQEISPVLSGISRVMPFSLPEGYFQSTLDELPALTSKEDSVVLSFIDREMPFEVPSDYFEKLPGQILSRVKPARVVPMFKRKWRQLAAAAVIAAIALSGILYYNGNFSQHTTKDPVAQLKKVSTHDLEEFIKTTDINTTATAHSSPSRNGDVKSMLHDVSDKELDAFLDQVPTEDEELAIN